MADFFSEQKSKEVVWRSDHHLPRRHPLDARVEANFIDSSEGVAPLDLTNFNEPPELREPQDGPQDGPQDEEEEQEPRHPASPSRGKWPGRKGGVVVSAPVSSGTEILDQKVQRIEVSELQTFHFGPFPSDLEVEIVRAYYGIPGDFSRQICVTVYLQEEFEATGCLKLSNFNRLFGNPSPYYFPANMLFVEYTLKNLKRCEVATGSAVETVDAVSSIPIMAAKVFTNVLGAGVACTGYALARSETAILEFFDRRSGVEEPKRSAADSKALEFGISSWLSLNGVFPTITYDNIEDAERLRNTAILVSNHICYLDGPILAAGLGLPRFMARKGTLNVPVIGAFCEALGVIEVDRDDQGSRQAAMNTIREHVDNWKEGDRPLLIFPEGKCSNGEGLHDFRVGAFVPGVPVRPVVLTWIGEHQTASTSFKKNREGAIELYSDTEWAVQFFGNVSHRARIRVLPSYDPSFEERENPKLYAKRVRGVMAIALQEEVRRKSAAMRAR